MKTLILITLIVLGCSLSVSASAQTSATEQIQRLQQQGAATPDAKRGKQLWYAKNGTRSCSGCHGQVPSDTGHHVKTRKAVKPMASSKNPARFTSLKKTEKWFLRNCKWTLGRVCTVQEKADILSWLSSQ
jgi:hypothetical protein